MTTDTKPLDLAAVRARAELVAARRHHWAREAGVTDPDVIDDLRRAKELAVDDVPRLVDEVRQLRGERAAMLRLIGDLVDADDCWFDHHGGCQAHGYLSLEPGEKCPQQEAKELIEAANGEEQR